MDALKIHTAANVEIDYTLAGLFARIWASLIDILVIIAICILFSVAYFWMDRRLGIGRYGQIVFYAILSFFYMFYHLVSELSMNGQSIGKRVMKIRVVDMLGNQASLKQYLIRWLFRSVDMGLTRGTCAALMYLMNDHHQRLGDYLAKTVVISDAPRAAVTVEQLASKVAKEAGTVAEKELLHYPQAKELSREDVAVIREAIRQSLSTGNPMLLVILADKLEKQLYIGRTESEPIQFLRQLLKDYSL